jgi:hypothetical protein
LSGSVQRLFGVIPIEDLSGAIAQHYAACRLGETTPRRLAEYPLGQGDRSGLVSEAAALSIAAE